MRKLIYLWLMVALPTCLLAHQAAIKGKVTQPEGSNGTSNCTTLTSNHAFMNAAVGATEITDTIILLKPNYI